MHHANQNLRITMDAYDPMPKSYNYNSVDSPGIEYDVSIQHQHDSEFFDNFLVFDEWNNEDQAPFLPEYPDHTPVNSFAATDEGSQSNIGSSSSNFQENGDTGNIGQVQKVTKERFAFRTQSKIEILDDGFKWRKYGKKMVKNSPNPRNYYRCSTVGCSVKKRVERDVDDARYVITTYEGVHNHQRPNF